MSAYTKILAALGIGLASLLGTAQRSGAEQRPITAIDIALEQDATMIAHAEAVNARLLKEYPIDANIGSVKSFALDATHPAHVTLLQRYVRTADLGKLYAAVNKVLVKEKIGGWKLEAFKYSYIPWKTLGLASIVIRPTDDLLRLQEELIYAVLPFSVATGTAAAFVSTRDERDISQPTIEYVETFVSRQTGSHFSPHVTVGIATYKVLSGLLAEPFDDFTFAPASVSIYQLGNNGTARTRLTGWEATP